MQELQGCGYVPVSIPVLSFQFDNQKELAEKMQAPESHGGRVLDLIPVGRCQRRLYVCTCRRSQGWIQDLSKAGNFRPAKLHTFCVKVPHFTCTSHTNFPYISNKFMHFCCSCLPYISLKLQQLQLTFMHFTYSNLAAM